MATNLAVAILVVGGGAALVWTGFTNPEEGLIGELGKVLRGEPTEASKRGGVKGIGAAIGEAGAAAIRGAGDAAAAAGSTGAAAAGEAAAGMVSATGVRGRVVAEARKHLGKRYVYGAKGPTSFDCSGLVQYVYERAAGKSIPAPSQLQCLRGRSVSEAAAQPGDLVCYGHPAWHIGIYLGGGQLLHAANPSKGVVVESVGWNGSRYYRDVLSGSTTARA